MGRFMNIPFHWTAGNDPAKRRRDRREFSTQKDAEEYEAQVEIENARIFTLSIDQRVVAALGKVLFKAAVNADEVDLVNRESISR